MRPTIFAAAAIAFFPLVAHSQTAPANLQAKLTPPAAPTAASSSSAAATPAPAPATTRAEVLIIDRGDDNGTSSAGAVSYSLVGSSRMATQPVLLHVVGMGIDAGQMPADQEEIAIRMTVDRKGVPSNLRLAHATGTALDSKALAAVSQYRFKPATLDNLPTEADVTVQVKLDKQ